jgi:uncharacterized protein YceK
MLALAINLLFAAIGCAAIISLIDSGMKAQRAYARLTREAALMQAGYVVQVDAQQLRVRRAGTSRVVARLDRRQSGLRSGPVLGMVPVPATGGA